MASHLFCLVKCGWHVLLRILPVDFIPLVGETRLTMTDKHLYYSYRFFVAVEKRERILGEGVALCLGLITKHFDPVMDPYFFPEFRTASYIERQPVLVNEAIVTYAQIPSALVNGIGRYEVPHVIHLRPDAVPYQAPPRRIAQALRPRVRHALDDMEAHAYIRRVPVHEHTPYISNILPVRQPGKPICLCLDPVVNDKNHKIQKNLFPLTTLEDVLEIVEGNDFFATIDMKKVFWQIPLHKSL